MRRLIYAAIFCFFATAAQAQSACPYIAYGAVLTAAQWNACFSAKQDALNYVPVNKAGDVMLGKLTMFTSSPTGAGINLPQGSAPTNPNNGDVWTTLAGMFVRINGFTIGPLAGANSVSFAATSPITVAFPSNVVTYGFNYGVAGTFTAAQAVNLNAASLPAALTGTAFRIGQADGVISRLEIDSFGASSPGVLSVVYGRGTGAAPTAAQSGDELGSFNSWGYIGAGTKSTTAVAAIRTYAAENFSSGHQGSKACIATTVIAGSTLTDGLCQQNDFGVTIGAPTAGSQGVGTLNAQGLFINGIAVASSATAITALTVDVAATGPGSVVATIQPNVVTYAKFQQVAALSLVGNATGSLANATGISTGTGVITALGVNVGTAGSIIVNGGALGTPSSGVVTNLTGTASININGTVGATTPATGAFTTATVSSSGVNTLLVTGTTINSAALSVDTSTASSVTGLNIKSAATGGGVALSVYDTGSNSGLTINAKGSGAIGIGSVSTGAVTITPPTTLSAALTYGGVTLSNAVTGTGAMVLATGPSVSSLTVTTAFTATGLVTNGDLATMATNTVKGNATSGSASPTDLAVGSCSTAASALIWTTNTGFGCNTSITAAAVPASGLTGTTLASGVVTSSLTTVGALGAGSATTGFTIAGASVTWSSQIAGANVAVVANASGSPSTTFGVMKADGTTIQCTSGTCSAVGGVATSVGVGSTTVTSGTTAFLLYNNGGTLGNEAATSIAFGTGTLNLAGNLTTTGAFNTTFAQAATTTVTLPGASAKMAALDLTAQVLSGGATVTAFSIGAVSSGTTTISAGNGPQQWMLNTGASTIAAPIADGSTNVSVTNGGSAGAITLSGFVKTTGSFATTLTASATCTITIASPAVITYTAHGLIAGQQIYFTTSGALPTGITSGTIYYLVPTIATNTFEIAATPGGTPIVTTGSQSGTQTCNVPSIYGLAIERTNGLATAAWYQKQ